jgi:hypothetical protein
VLLSGWRLPLSVRQRNDAQDVVEQVSGDGERGGHESRIGTPAAGLESYSRSHPTRLFAYAVQSSTCG